ncbi:MAG: zinc-dependent metalloprotease [Candidatus Eremiobacteraeota bacterium]|nr:zinc-dependent metalloprotease [Candidatus Eremiobacteraeota bacterium]
MAIASSSSAFAAAAPTPQPLPITTPLATPSAAASSTPTAAPSASPLPRPSALPSAVPSASPPSETGSGEPPARTNAAYDAFVKDAVRQSGLIDVLRKDDDVYFEIPPNMLDHTIMVVPQLAAGIGGGAFGGRVYDTFLLRFQKVGKRILWISPNARFRATPGTPSAAALAISVANSVIASTPILASNGQNGNVVVSAGLFLSDFENVGADLGRAADEAAAVLISFGRAVSFSLDQGRSYIAQTKAFPKNVEILAALTFSGPQNSLPAVPDARGVQIKMHYSLVDLPEDKNFVPRLADDRVGFFITAHKRFSDDSTPTPLVRYIDRWNLDRRPIVYYLSREIPSRYRAPIRRALLTWNDAFAKIGYPHAVLVLDAPKSAAWDPDDARYSTVRWITSDQPDFAAYGPPLVNPLTGEIFGAKIVIEGETLRSVKRGYADTVLPTRRTSLQALVQSQSAATGASQPDQAESGAPTSIECADFDCAFQRNFAEGAALGTLAAQLGLAPGGGSPQRFADDYLQSVVLHESGHNFGLRHNFKASTAYSPAQLRNPRFTAVHGLAASVMDYLPVNLWPAQRSASNLFQLRLGPYDYWAIRYGYGHVGRARAPGDELAALRRIAAQSARPELEYGTDEDANGPFALDPRIAPFDLSSDPLEFDRGQFAIADSLVAKLDTNYPRDGRGYSSERQSFLTIMRAYARASQLAARYVGGVYTTRAHRDHVKGRPTFTPVSRSEQRRAFLLLDRHIFSARALRFPPRLLADLGADHNRDWNSSPQPERQDFPVSDFVAQLQDASLVQMFSPITLSRLNDAQFEVARPQDAVSPADVFEWTRASVWDSVQGRTVGDIPPLHRALQARYTDFLITVSLASAGLLDSLGFPSDVQPLARHELARLSPELERAVGLGVTDTATQAHLEESNEKVRRALDAIYERHS